MNHPDIAIIINSFNRLTLLKKCLGVLSEWMPGSAFHNRCVCVVYDAGSTDGSIEWLKSESLHSAIALKIITPEPGDDTSFAAGLNTGVTYAQKAFPFLRYLLFYETDNQILESKPLSQALAQLENKKDLAACGFTVRHHNGKPAGVGQPFPNLLNFALGKNIVHWLRLEAIPYKWEVNNDGVAFSEIDVVYTSPLLVKIEAWKKSGGLDSALFPFSDCDVDWARRLWNLGWRMGVIRTASVIHDNQQSISSWSKSRALQFHRGRLRYFQKYHPVTRFIVWPVILFVRHFFEFISTKLFIKEAARREHLSKQFLLLLKTCSRRYE
jgi:GT2 family glycosyltransferase